MTAAEPISFPTSLTMRLVKGNNLAANSVGVPDEVRRTR